MVLSEYTSQEIEYLQLALTLLSTMVAHLKQCSNGESKCCKLLEEALKLLQTKTPHSQTEDVMLKLRQARLEIPNLKPLSPPPGIDRPLDKTARRKKLSPLKFNIKYLRIDIGKYLTNAMYYVNFMNPPPNLTRSTNIGLNTTALLAMRACLDAREALF